jgi:hypothetical protein
MTVVEAFTVEHSEILQQAYKEALTELGGDLVFLVNMQAPEGVDEPILEVYDRRAFLTSTMPDLLKDIVEEPAEEGAFWVLIYDPEGSISALQVSAA